MSALKAEKNPLAAVERYLPKHLMAYTADVVKGKGFEFRDDINQALILNAAADITLYAPPMQDTVIEIVNSLMPGMCRTLPNDPVQALLASSMFLTMLVDRGGYHDLKSSAVATALLLNKEAEEDPELWGLTPEKVSKHANNLITFCNLKGLYLTSIVH